MHVKAKLMAFGGLFLALAVIFMILGSIIETSTLFLLAAASFFVGVIIREAGLRAGAVFYLAAVLLGFILAPNKFYVFTFAAMGFYIWGIEAAWRWLERHHYGKRSHRIFWGIKFIIFNLVYVPVVLLFREILFVREVSEIILIAVVVAGQIFLVIYDRAYEYVQADIWGKMRGRILK